MTPTEGAVDGATSGARTYLMCPPEHYTVTYAINPWMNLAAEPVDAAAAMRQWEQLKATYTSLGHTVRTIPAEPGLPDMVFAANGATVIDGKVLGARFTFAERAAEGPAYMNWFRANGYATVAEPRCVNEGEGDIIYGGRAVFAGHGFRTDIAVADEVGELFGLPVIPLRLVDPHFYHLDTALIVLTDEAAAYFPGAFDEAGQAALRGHFAELIEAKEEDARVLGLNAVSDGRHVVMPAQARALASQIRAAGLEVVPVDMSEFMKAGGGPKCCTLNLR
jgi:N-dimethylarginine dimethylaminohydrolase